MQYAPPPGPPPLHANALSIQYAPPPYPPPRNPLIHTHITAPYPIDLELLAHQGWLSLPLAPAPSDPLHGPFSALFAASAAFFALPEPAKAAHAHAHKDKSHASEEGYSHIPGEKCLVTLRRRRTTPAECDLRARAEAAWAAGAAVMRAVLLAIEDSLGMERGVLERTVGPQMELPEQTHASLMRMFRYERPLPREEERNEDTSRTESRSDPPEADVESNFSEQKPEPTRSENDTIGSNAPSDSRIVSEAHRDLGLLTIVIGHTPGLECWSPELQQWIACEETAQPYDENGQPRLTASLLTGQTLSRFTNNRYTSGRHRVLVHPIKAHASSALDPAPEKENPLLDPSYRFSLVHALRAHYPVTVSSSEFTTPVTGHYPPQSQFSNVSIREIYMAITNSHWNVNIDPEIRRKQQEDAKERTRQILELEKQSLDMMVNQPQSDENVTANKEKRRSVTFPFKSLFKRTTSI